MPLGSAVAFAFAFSTADPRAVALVDTAIARMGGQAALEQIVRLRVEQMTEWQRAVVDERLSPLVGSYERDTEWRDYSVPAWRYVRRFIGATGTQEIIDVVADSVAITSSSVLRPLANDTAARPPITWRPLSVAYVDERTELFLTSADRLLLYARAAGDLRALRDTSINGALYARVAMTADSAPVTIYILRRTGMLAMAEMKKGQERDFGLVPWGVMDVQVRYSKWTRTQSGASLPYQLDVYRVGAPYKRVTWLGAQINPAIPADSFAVSDSLRKLFFATQNRPMHDLPVDTAKIVDNAFAIFGTSGTPVGALKLGGAWIMFESGAAPLSAQRSMAYLAKADPSSRVAGALLTLPAGAGGAAHYAGAGVPMYVTAGAKPYVDLSAKGWNVKPAAFRPATDGRWIRVGSDSLIVESVELPEMARAAVVYVPSLKWLYSPAMTASYGRDLILDRARQRGWVVERITGPGMPFNGVIAPK